MNILDKLYELSDKEYASFSYKLIPTVDKDLFIGVRVPVMRQFAKEIYNSDEAKEFIKVLPHKYFDEYLLHGLLLDYEKDFDVAIKEINRFLPYVDNWAVSDITSPKVFRKNKEKLMKNILKWCDSNLTYTIRFGISMLMSYYLDDDFKKEYLNIPIKIKSDEYYVNMMIAWFYATALTKQYDETIKIIENKLLSPWVHNKTIQKAVESYRITPEQKAYLKSLKIK